MKNSKSTASAMIVQSLLWAAAMIAASIILRGTEYSEKIFYLLFFLWTGSYLTLIDSPGIHAEWRCIQRFFRLRPKTE